MPRTNPTSARWYASHDGLGRRVMIWAATERPSGLPTLIATAQHASYATHITRLHNHALGDVATLWTDPTSDQTYRVRWREDGECIVEEVARWRRIKPNDVSPETADRILAAMVAAATEDRRAGIEAYIKDQRAERLARLAPEEGSD